MAVAFNWPIFTSRVLAQRRNGETSYTEFYPDQTINMESIGTNTFTHVENYNLVVTEPIITKLALPRQLFERASHTEFPENQTNSLATDVSSETDGQGLHIRHSLSTL